MADFLDTNIWVYAHTADAKSVTARRLLGDVEEAVISTQVLGEYSAVMIRNRLPDMQVRHNLEEMMAMCRTLSVSIDTVRQSWDLRRRYGFSFWECQLIAAALEAGCERPYTEGLQHEQAIAGQLTVVNPFMQPPKPRAVNRP